MSEPLECGSANAECGVGEGHPYIAYLTKFSRDGVPVVQVHNGHNYVEALQSHSVVWVLQFSAHNYDGALNTAARELREGRGVITTAGQFEGWQFPSDKSAADGGRK